MNKGDFMSISREELSVRLWRYRQQNWNGVQTPAWQKRVVEQQMSFDAVPVIRAIVDQFNLESSKIRYLDLGSGIGDYVLAARKLGIEAYGIEPDQIGVGSIETSLSIARDRADDPGWFNEGIGEALPFDDSSFDLITMNQVLEHVQDVNKVLMEALRVLKSGGVLLFNTPNYLSFYEPHYKVFWLPLFPRTMARIYLRLRGRDTRFLNGINYVTRSQFNHILEEMPCSFYDEQLKNIELRMRQVNEVNNYWLRTGAKTAHIFGLDKLAMWLYVNFFIRGLSFVVKKNN
jgi:ubiquinone/menaquinone biosynthesis C-methylase UbiE